MNLETKLYHVSFAGLVILVLATFTSLSVSAGSHILLFIPGLYFLVKAIKDPDFKFKKSWWALLVLTLVCIASVLLTSAPIEEPLKKIIKTKYFILALLSSCTFYYLKKNYLNIGKYRFLLNGALVATTIATISGLIGLYTGMNPLKMKAACHSTRACGLYGMYMTYGYGISLFMVLITGLVIYKDQFKEYLNTKILVIAFIVNMIGLIFSFARGGWLGFLIAVPFLFFKNHKKKFFICVGSCLILFGGSFALSDKVQDVFLKRSGSNAQRISFFKAAYYAAKQSPLLGLGYKNFEARSSDIKKKYDLKYKNYKGHAHSNFLEHLASTGILGLLALIAFVSLWLYECYSYPILFSFVTSFIVSGMTQYTFGDGENLFLILGVFSFF